MFVFIFYNKGIQCHPKLLSLNNEWCIKARAGTSSRSLTGNNALSPTPHPTTIQKRIAVMTIRLFTCYDLFSDGSFRKSSICKHKTEMVCISRAVLLNFYSNTSSTQRSKETRVRAYPSSSLRRGSEISWASQNHRVIVKKSKLFTAPLLFSS